jgi:hypothetical protein
VAQATTGPAVLPVAAARVSVRVQRGDGFDVAAVRAYCERLVGEGERLAEERVVFADWTRAQGKGPENRERGAFVQFSPSVEAGLIREWRSVFKCGGWPGSLAREYGWERCKACRGRRSTIAATPGGRGYPLQERCSACKGRGRTRKPGIHPGFANGDSIGRTARRLLDALDGSCPWAPSASAQASECRSCERYGVIDRGDGIAGQCPACRGTGRNLAGVLPEVEHPAPRVSEDERRGRLQVAATAAFARFNVVQGARLQAMLAGRLDARTWPDTRAAAEAIEQVAGRRPFDLHAGQAAARQRQHDRELGYDEDDRG